MPNAKVIIEITPSGFDIEWTNWEGVTNITIERMHYAIVKQLQVMRAQKLGVMHGEKMQAEAAARKVEGDKIMNQKLSEEISNALQ